MTKHNEQNATDDKKQAKFNLERWLINSGKFTVDKQTHTLFYLKQWAFSAPDMHAFLQRELEMDVPLTTCGCKIDALVATMERLESNLDINLSATLEQRFLFQQITPDKYDTASVDYIKSIPNWDVFIWYLGQILQNKIPREVIFFIGKGKCGKTTVTNKLFAQILNFKHDNTVTESRYCRYIKPGKYDHENSQIVRLDVFDDTLTNDNPQWIGSRYKTSANPVRVVECKFRSPVNVEAPVAILTLLNGPVYFLENDIEPILDDRMIIIPGLQQKYTSNPEFMNAPLDRNTVISMALAQTTYTPPADQDLYKALWRRWINGQSRNCIASASWEWDAVSGKYGIQSNGIFITEAMLKPFNSNPSYSPTVATLPSNANEKSK